MSTKLAINPTERGTLKIIADFEDENGIAITPKTATWTLTDAGGNVVNSRSKIAFAPLDTTVFAVLSGADLALTGSTDSGQRVVTVEALYDSIIGMNLPINEQATFDIQGLIAVN